MIKKYLKAYIYTFSIIIIATILITILNYFNILNGSVSDVIKLITNIIAMFIGSFILGKNSLKKGYLEGLKYGSLFILFIFLINIIFIRYLELKLIIYYLILLITTTLASMFGINFKKNN